MAAASAAGLTRPVNAGEHIQHAIQSGQFAAHYQPILDAEGKVRAVEALARWNHPSGRTLPPTEFVAEATAAGVLAHVDYAVLLQALSDQVIWHRWKLDLHANVDVQTLAHPAFAEWLDQALTGRSFEARRLVLEIDAPAVAAAESTQGWSQIVDTLTSVRRLDVGIAIQDFAGGAISPVLVERDLVTMLKLHQAITRKLDPVDLWDDWIKQLGAWITESNLAVTAVGVVSDRSADAARELGCTSLQGFHYGFPTGSDKILAEINTLQDQ
ncbi:MAG: EAL domain-containing protein [Acidimicrobiia bacterium]|nr:EAL domain-containing protein [Acidimicrobiia bacterium]